MVNSSAMLEPALVVSGEEGQDYSFAEVLDSSPPSAHEAQFTRKPHQRKASHDAALRRQSSRPGFFGRFAHGRLRTSMLKHDNGPEKGRSFRASFMLPSSDRQSMQPTSRVGKRPTGPRRNPSYGGSEIEAPPRTSTTTQSKERISRMASDPPPLGSAYSQAIKYGPVMSPAGSVDAILRSHKAHEGSKKSNPDNPTTDKTPSVSGGAEPFVTKIYVLTTTGYMLQYACEGNYDRLPEKIMHLTSNSAAMACDAIPGKHWVLRVTATFEEDEVIHHRSRFAFSKLGLGAPTKTDTRNLLLIMESADELDAWLVALRREIQSLGGVNYKPDVLEQKTLEEQVGRSLTGPEEEVIKKPTSSHVARPAFDRAVSAPERVATHRVTNSMAKQGLLLRMDESDPECEAEESVSPAHSQGPQHGHTGATSPKTPLSISDRSSHRSKPSTDTTASKAVPASNTKGENQSQESGHVQSPQNDLDSVIEAIIPRHRVKPEASPPGKRTTGLRKKGSTRQASSMCALVDVPLSATSQSSQTSLQPLSSGFKRLSPLANIRPIVLTPPESPEFSIRPRSMSMLEAEATLTSSPGAISIHSPISDPGMLSPNRILTDPSMRSPRSPRSPKITRKPSPAQKMAANGSRNDSTSSVNSDHQSTDPTGRIPPRHSSLMYSHGHPPSSGGSSSVSSPSSAARKGSTTPAKTEKLKSRLSALDTTNLPATNALLLAPSPHPPPTAALPDLPRNRSPATSRPESRQDQSRKPSVISLASERAPSAASLRKPSDAERAPSAASIRRPSDTECASSAASIRRPSDTERSASMVSVRRPSDVDRAITPEPPLAVADHSSSPIEQITPRKARVEKIILPPISQVPAMRPTLPMHPSVGPPPNLTVVERRRRRSPSPVHGRGRSGSNAEKVLSAISEMTEASDTMTLRERRIAMDEIITIGLEVPVEEQELYTDQASPDAARAPSMPNRDLLPNGMPNPLAANPIKTPDMRMIPHRPTREAPPVPALPDLHPPVPPKDHNEDMVIGLGVQIVAAGDLEANTKAASAPPPLARKMSMRERAAAAIAAAKTSHEHKHEAKDERTTKPGSVETIENKVIQSIRDEIRNESATRPMFHERSSSLENKASFHARSSSLENRPAAHSRSASRDNKIVFHERSSSLENRSAAHSRSASRDNKIVFHERSSSLENRAVLNKTKGPSQAQEGDHAKSRSHAEMKTGLFGAGTEPVSTHPESTTTSTPVSKKPRPDSSTEKEALPDSLAPSHPRHPQHIADMLLIPELPAEPTTPPPPEMKASITAFGQDEFDMWAWSAAPVGSPEPEYAPLYLDLEDNVNADSGQGAAGGDGGKSRWSLFNAIDRIQ